MKHVTKITLVIGLGTAIIGGFIFAPSARAHSPAVHSPLMERSAELYNDFYPESGLTSREIEWLAQGSAEEDSPFARPLHHFYDPINNKGLRGYRSSKLWARDGEAQAGIGGDYSWEEALNAYKRGDKEKAYKALGHVVHLIQDSAVPAHTRNDPHPHGGETFYGGPDPFEQAVKDTERFKIPSTAGLSPAIYSDLDTYFDRTALYTNRHFYSKDSVGFYEEPVPVRIENDYVYGRDSNGEYRLMKIKPEFWDYNNDSPVKYTLADPLVLQDYWKRLAPHAIENGAGVIKLFKDSVEEEVVVKEQEENLWDKTKSWLGNTSEKLFSWLDFTSGFGEVSLSTKIETDISFNCSKLDIYLKTSPGSCSSTDVNVSLVSREEGYQAQQNLNGQLQGVTNTTETEQDPAVGRFDFPRVAEDSSDATDKTDTTDPASGEGEASKTYMVSRVIDGDTIELENGEIVRYIGVNAPEEPNGCFAGESTQFNKEMVENKKIRLGEGPTDKDDYNRLLRYVYTEGGILVNEALVQTGSAYAFDYNDPHRFSEKFEKLESEAREERRGLWGGKCHPIEGEVKGDSTSSSSFGLGAPYGPLGPGSQPQLRQQNSIPGADIPDHLVINELQAEGSEFVELYNPTSTAIDLQGYYLSYYPKDRTDISDPHRNWQFPADSTISAGQDFLIEIHDSEDTIEPDWQVLTQSGNPYSRGQLSNEAGTVAIFSENPREAQDPEPIDTKTWGTTISWQETVSFDPKKILTDESSNIYLASRDTISSLTPEGAPRWENKDTERFLLGTALSPGGGHLYANECFYMGKRNYDCFFFALDTASGEEAIDKIDIGAQPRFGPLPDPQNGNVYVAGRASLYAFNLQKENNIAWQKPYAELGGTGGTITSLATYEGLLYGAKHGSQTGGLSVINPADGELIKYHKVNIRRMAFSGDYLYTGYTAGPCGANRENGVRVFDISDIENTLPLAKEFKLGCSGRATNIKANPANNFVYTVPGGSGLWPNRSIRKFSLNSENEITVEYIFSLGANLLPSGTITFGDSGNLHLFARKTDASGDVTGSRLFTLSSEGDTLNSFDFEQSARDIALSPNRLYLLLKNTLSAIDL